MVADRASAHLIAVGEPAQHLVLSSLREPDFPGQLKAISTIGRLCSSSSEAVPELVHLLQSPDPGTSKAAGVAIAEIGAPANDALLGLLHRSDEPKMTARCIAALSRIAQRHEERNVDKRVVSALLENLQASNESVMLDCLSGLACAAHLPKDALDQIAALLDSPSADTRAMTAHALRQRLNVSDEVATRLQVIALSDPVEFVRQAASDKAPRAH
jgi:HEAT repeat protein